MSDLHESSQWLRDHPGESIFADPERERRKLATEWGDRLLVAITVALWLVLLAEVVLRVGFGIRTVL